MTDPKGQKPKSDQPIDDDLSLELHQDLEGMPVEGENHPGEPANVSASTEDFQFTGPAEELDFTEPSDFTFPTEQIGEAEVAPEEAVPAEAAAFFAGPEGTVAETTFGEEGAAESELAGDGIADLEAAEEPSEAEEEKPKPKFELPPWVRTVEWVTIGVLGVGSLLALIIGIIWVQDPKHVSLILNIGCPVMLALIPYALWRSSPRWVTPAASSIYTVMLALAAAMLIVGTWLEGVELSRYDWQYSKARVTAAKPKPVIFVSPTDVKEPEAAVEPAKGSAAPAEVPAAAKDSAAPAPAKDAAAAKDTTAPAAK